MTPGRELDALIAERVMGFKKSPSRRCDCGFDPHLKSYSTDISAAWEVVEKMRENKVWSFRLFSDQTANGYKWVVFFKGGGPGKKYQDIMMMADTAPHAICLAALEAIGDKV